MRVPTNSNSNQMLERISQLSSRQAKMQQQVATGQRIFQPQDDPAAVGRVLTLDWEKRQLTQFEKNAAYALDLSQASYSGVNELKKISDRAGEIGVLGSGAVSSDAFNAYAAEVDQLLEQGLQLANSKLRNDYLFGGTAVEASPFASTRAADGMVTSVAYDGNMTRLEVPISENSSVSPGTTGATNTDIRDFLNHLVALRDALKQGSVTAVQSAQTGLNADENNIVAALSEHGAVQLRIEISQSQRQYRLDNIEKLVSDETDVEMAEAITRLNQTSVAYQAALQSTAQIMQISLLDYIN